MMVDPKARQNVAQSGIRKVRNMSFILFHWQSLRSCFFSAYRNIPQQCSCTWSSRNASIPSLANTLEPPKRFRTVPAFVFRRFSWVRTSGRGLPNQTRT